MTDLEKDLLKALNRCVQYIHVAIIDGRKSKLSESTIRIAENDLRLVQDTIAKAKQ